MTRQHFIKTAMVAMPLSHTISSTKIEGNDYLTNEIGKEYFYVLCRMRCIDTRLSNIVIRAEDISSVTEPGLVTFTECITGLTLLPESLKAFLPELKNFSKDKRGMSAASIGAIAFFDRKKVPLYMTWLFDREEYCVMLSSIVKVKNGLITIGEIKRGESNCHLFLSGCRVVQSLLDLGRSEWERAKQLEKITM